jgi:ribosomal protein L37E
VIRREMSKKSGFHKKNETCAECGTPFALSPLWVMVGA